MSYIKKPVIDIPKSRIELHVHLDGSLRAETIWELSKKKNLPLPGSGSLEDLKKELVCTDPINLQHFLKSFQWIIPSISGDFAAIERIAYEFCEDKAAQGVLYVEARYNPHIMLSSFEEARGRLHELGEVIKAVQRGFTRGEQEFGIKVRSILCSLSGANLVDDVLKLCEQFRGDVVAIDSAALSTQDARDYVEVPIDGAEQRVYLEARRLGIHRTIHAGEAGNADMVQRAVERLDTERIGHGYNVVKDHAVYRNCRDKHIHFEACPWSSMLTGSVPMNHVKHPIVQFAQDGANFSINTDDTTVTGRDMAEEYSLVATWGLTEAHLARANMNAAKSCFLPEQEKAQLIRDLRKIYGFGD